MRSDGKRKSSGRSTCMTDFAPSRTGTLPSISMNSASENLKTPCKDPFPERGHQTTMSSSKVCTARKSHDTVVLLEPIVTNFALERPYSYDPTANIIPRTPIHLRNLAGFPSSLVIFHLEGRRLGGSQVLCTSLYTKTAFDKRP